MSDAEYISSLLRLTIDGIQTDTPKQLDNYYRKYDDNLPNAKNIEALFTKTMSSVKEILNNDLYSFRFFSRKNYIYTLFCYFLLIDNNLKNYTINNKVSLIKFDSTSDLCKVLSEIEYHLSSENEEDTLSVSFLRYHKIRTTNENERKLRLTVLLELLDRECSNNE